MIDEQRIEEIIFFETGFTDIGYHILKKLLFKMRMKERFAIGAF